MFSPLPAFLLPSRSLELTGTDVPLPFQRMPVCPGQLLLVALDWDVGFVSEPTTAFMVQTSGCVHLSFLSPSQITINERASFGTEQIALCFLLDVLLMILWHLILAYSSL